MKRDDSIRDATLALARVALGGSIAAHGAQKLFGWFGGPGIEGTETMMEGLGFKPPAFYARASSAAEITSGILIAMGALGPVGPGMLVSVMAVAAGSVHFKNGYFAANQGFELNALYGIAAITLATADAGRLSIDEVMGWRERTSPLFGALAIAGGVVMGAYILSRRQGAAPSPAREQNWPRSESERGTIDAPAASVAPNSDMAR